MVRATFFGIEIGKTGLVVSQNGLDVTGHNIANVDTAGYTRQRIISTAYDPFATIGRALPVDQANVGGGVHVKILDQIRSAYLDRRYRTENTLNSYWQKRTESLTYLESYFDNVNEETSINYSISSFFGAMKVTSADPVESAQRTPVQTSGKDLVQQLNSIYDGLVDLQTVQNQAVDVTVTEINRIAAELVSLNKSIYGYEATGYIANDLRDKRNLLLDDLSNIVDIDYTEYSDGKGNSKLQVSIGGKTLVDHDQAWTLGTREVDNPLNPDGAKSLIPIWTDHTQPNPNLFEAFLDNKSKTPITLIGVDMTDKVAVDARIAEINNIKDAFAQLDVQVVGGVLTGTDASQAYALSQQMRSIVGNVDVVECEYPGQHAMITINGLDFAPSKGCIKMYSTPSAASANAPMPEPADVKITSGELGAYLDMRDGDGIGANAKGIPYYINMLNNLARALVQEINSVHRQGWTDPPGTKSQTNVDFFAAKDADGNYISLGYWATNDDPPVALDAAAGYTVNDFGQYVDSGGNIVDLYAADSTTGDPLYKYVYNDLSVVTAKNICLSAAIESSEYNIACSSVKIVKEGNPEELQRGNNENMNALYKLFERNNINLATPDVSASIGSFDGYATKIRFDVANTLSIAKKTADTSNTLTISADNQRISISGVSLDEEMTNLIKYQHAYSGASRVITAMDDALDRLINGTGRVGL